MPPASVTERKLQVGSPSGIPHCFPQRHKFHAWRSHVLFTGDCHLVLKACSLSREL